MTDDGSVVVFDTQVTIVGNALNTPEWRKLEANRAMVAKFKIAATSRRYDREHGRWVDGASLRVRVNCWRRLAENVAASVLSGDPLIVTGRMYTRDWIGDDGQRRVSYELDAVAVGHDLSRGQANFTRHRPALSTSAIDDEPAGGRGTDRPVPPGAGAQPAEASSGRPVAPAAAPDRDADTANDAAGALGAARLPEATGDLDTDSKALALLREAGLATGQDGHDHQPGAGASLDRPQRENPLVGVSAVTEPA